MYKQISKKEFVELAKEKIAFKNTFKKIKKELSTEALELIYEVEEEGFAGDIAFEDVSFNSYFEYENVEDYLTNGGVVEEINITTFEDLKAYYKGKTFFKIPDSEGFLLLDYC